MTQFQKQIQLFLINLFQDIGEMPRTDGYWDIKERMINDLIKQQSYSDQIEND